MMSIKDMLEASKKKAEAKAKKEAAKKAAASVVAGAAVGVAAGVLLAPKPGKETRAQIAERAKKVAAAVKQKGSITDEKEGTAEAPKAE